MSEIKRLNYFIGQFLTADDFLDEQAYHLGQRRRNNRLRYGPGILGGFQVTPGETVDSIEVSRGTAIDAMGQEIVLLDPVTLNIAAAPAGNRYVVVYYKEEQDPADERQDAAYPGVIRVTERPKIELRDALPSGDKVGLELVIARILVTVAAGQRQVAIRNDDALGQPLSQASRLRSLDTEESLGATIRAADLWLGHSDRSGRPKRALVDVGKTPAFGDTLANKNGLIVNYGDDFDPGWDYVMVKGDLYWGSGSGLTANQHGSLELGGRLYNIGSTRTPFIDFHYKDGEDYNTRIINDGDGLLSIVAPKLYASGNVGIGTTTPTAGRLQFGNTLGNKIVVWDSGAEDRYGFGLNGYNLSAFVPKGATFSVRQNGYDGNEVFSVAGKGECAFLSGALSVDKTWLPNPVFAGKTFTTKANLKLVGDSSLCVHAQNGLAALVVDGPIMSTESGAYFAGNVGIGTTTPKSALQVVGAAVVNDGLGVGSAAANNSNMAAGSLTIGSTESSFGGGTGWNSNTAGLLLETKDNTEIAVHDAGHRLASIAYYEGGSANRLTIGRDMGWGTISEVVLMGDVNVGATGANRCPLRIPEKGLQIGTGTDATRNFHFVSDDYQGKRALRVYSGNYGAGTHLLTILNDGNVGIGTMKPTAGRLQFSNEGGNKLVVYDTGPTDRYGFGLNSGNLNAFVPTGGRFSLRQNGYDGTEVFSVAGTGECALLSGALSVDKSWLPNPLFAGKTFTSKASLKLDGDSSLCLHSQNGLAALVVDGPIMSTESGAYFAGKVGIGTTTPSSKLHIVDEEISTPTEYEGSFGYPNLLGKFIAGSATRMWGLANSYGILCNWNSDSCFIGLKDEGNNRKDMIIAFGDDIQDSLRILFTLSGTPAPAPIELLRITSDGKVGIGTTAPRAPLTIAGPAATTAIESKQILHLLRPVVSGVKNSNSAGLDLGSFETGVMGRSRLDIKLAGSPDDKNQYGADPDVTVMSLQADGKVGIGTMAPTGRLSVLGGALTVGSSQQSADAAIHVNSAFGQFGRLLQMSVSGAYKPALNLLASRSDEETEQWWAWGVTEEDEWRIQPATDLTGSAGLTIDRAGRVGIGTSDPQEKLDVNGALYASEGIMTRSFQNEKQVVDLFKGGMGDPIRVLFAHLESTPGSLYMYFNSGYGDLVRVDLQTTLLSGPGPWP